MKKNLLAVLVLGSTVMAGCSAPTQEEIDALRNGQPMPSASSAPASTPSSMPPSSSPASTSPSMPAGHTLKGKKGETEVQQLPNRAAIAFAGGVKIYDPHKGELLGSEGVDGELTLADAHDGRHVMVVSGGKARLLDMGLVARPHGNHFHYYTAAPKLTDSNMPAGQVTVHDGLTAVAGQGVRVYKKGFDSPTTTVEGATGPALAFKDGTVLAAQDKGTLALFDSSGKVQTTTTNCQGINGSATVGDTAVFACTSGVVVFAGKKFSTVEGALPATVVTGSEESKIVAADDLVHNNIIQLIDPGKNTARAVELKAPLVPGGLARGPLGEVLVLTTDGVLSILDPDSGEVTTTVAATTGKLVALDGYAFILNTESKQLLDVDLYTGKVLHRHELDFQPTDMVVL